MSICAVLSLPCFSSSSFLTQTQLRRTCFGVFAVVSGVIFMSHFLSFDNATIFLGVLSNITTVIVFASPLSEAVSHLMRIFSLLCFTYLSISLNDPSRFGTCSCAFWHDDPVLPQSSMFCSQTTHASQWTHITYLLLSLSSHVATPSLSFF